MTMIDRSHLHAIELRLSHERERLLRARSDTERRHRAVWVASVERELAAERRFLGLAPIDPAALDALTDDDLLAALES